METIAEGRAVRFIKDGRFDVENFKSKELSKDELFSDMHKEGATHLGQIKSAYMEPGGDISVFYFEDEKVQYGLPLFPELNENKLTKIKEATMYAVAFVAILSAFNQQSIIPARFVKKTPGSKRLMKSGLLKKHLNRLLFSYKNKPHSRNIHS